MSWYAKNLDASRHCFFGIEGGVSEGKYASLNTNVYSLDNQANIRRNFEIVSEYFQLQPENMFTLRQSITNRAVAAEKPSWFKIGADGAVTTKQNILLGIKTADCAPVLLADYKHGIIGAAHAGWRGALSGIVQNVVSLMVEKGAKPDDIAAAIGPCMQSNSFEVKSDMRQEFLQKGEQNEKYFQESNDGEHFYFDLSRFVFDKLLESGVENICNSGIDTYPLTSGYFSYRRNTHLKLIDAPYDYPTQYSCIRL